MLRRGVKTTGLLELSMSLILVAFAAYMPLVFQDAVADCDVVTDVPGCTPDEAVLLSMERAASPAGEWQNATVATVATLDPRLRAESPSTRWTAVVSVLIAFMGGGVFSLDEFEAFPML
mmetsp:Transcript_87214/g.266894  ORF Transcript_87214/g.266894 Transcript_87214/m.266894 type:complete len:119 (-) Transcript_87214:196-552(-)